METFKLSEIVFYTFSSILPIILVLYCVSYLVYTIGEYMETKTNLSLGILLVTLKIFLITFMLLISIYIIMDNNTSINVSNIIIFLCGNLICLESVAIIRTLNMVTTVIKNSGCNLKTKTYELYFKSKKLFYFKIIFVTAIIFISLFLGNIYLYELLPLLSMLILYNIFNWYIVKYVMKTV